MKQYLHFIILLLSSLTLPATASNDSPPLKPIAALDVQRYMGTWYEIARYPNRFERKCVKDTTANYSLRPDARLAVLNSCKQQDGSLMQASAVARQTGAENSPTLEVRFAPAWLSFLPIVWADYWVIDIDKDYQMAAVSEPRREYLWILSRTPKVDQHVYAELLTRLAAKGFDLNKLVLSQQSD